MRKAAIGRISAHGQLWQERKAQAIAGHGVPYLSSQAMQEAEIGRVAAPGHSRPKKSWGDPHVNEKKQA
jgi:hypothetical protein